MVGEELYSKIPLWIDTRFDIVVKIYSLEVVVLVSGFRGFVVDERAVSKDR